jgi:hypothetical protein
VRHQRPFRASGVLAKVPQQRHPDIRIGVLINEDVGDDAHDLAPKSFLLHGTTLLCSWVQCAARPL